MARIRHPRRVARAKAAIEARPDIVGFRTTGGHGPYGYRYDLWARRSDGVSFHVETFYHWHDLLAAVPAPLRTQVNS